MKKIILFLILLLLPILVRAQDFPLTNKVISYAKIEEYDLQGFTVVKDKLFTVLIDNDERSMIKVYDLKTYKEVYSKKLGSLGHANDVTYDSLNNIVYVLASGGSSIMYAFDGDTYSFIDTVNIKYPARSITYMEDKDMYAIRTVSLGFLLNSDFTSHGKLPFVMGMNFSEEVGRQGWTYYNSLIYYSNWSWIRYGGDGSNFILVYDLNGDLLGELHTPPEIGELEDVGFYNNKMILGINGYNDNIYFYEEDIPELVILNDVKVEDEDIEDEKNSFNYVYIVLGIVVIICLVFIIFRKKKKQL